MSLELWIVGPLIGFIGMMSGGYWGVGCGWIVVPTMLILGFSPFEAVGIGLLQMAPSTLPTVIRQFPEIGWGPGSAGRCLALPLGTGAMLTSLAGKSINARLFDRFGAAPLSLMLCAVILAIAVQTLCSRTRCYDDELPPLTPRMGRIAFGTGLATGLLSSMLGVGGGILAVVEKRMGIGIYGPALNEKGNSIGGSHVLEYLSKELNLHMFAAEQ